MSGTATIYHIVTRSDLRAHTADGRYVPGGFAADGFIHCTQDPASTLLVLEDYFMGVPEGEPVLVLEIDTAGLHAEVRFEPPAPITGGGTSHLRDGLLFPHIYGSLNMDAVRGTGRAERNGGRFSWPEAFSEVEEYL